MKDSFRTFMLAGGSFGILVAVFVGVPSNFIHGIIAMLISGFLFGTVISVFVAIHSKGFKKNILEISGGKNVVFDGVANHIRGMESVGGWLCLTSDELIFKSHNFNFQKHKSIIPLNQITEVKTSLTLGLVPNGLKIITNSSVERFIVSERKEWIQKITEAISLKNNFKFDII